MCVRACESERVCMRVCARAHSGCVYVRACAGETRSVWSARDVAAICIVNVVGQQQQQQEHQQHQQQQRNGAVSILVDVRNCINCPCQP